MKSILCQLPRIGKIVKKRVFPSCSFESIAAAFAEEEGTVVFLSGSDLDCARYHILAARPWVVFTTKGMDVELKYGDSTLNSFSFTMEPFDALNHLISHFKMDFLDTEMPVASGVFGYLSYDIKDRIESLPITCIDHGLPDIFFVVPSFVLVHDRQKHVTELMVPVLEAADTSHPSQATHNIVMRWIQEAEQVCLGAIASTEPYSFHAFGKFGGNEFSMDASSLKSNFSKADYMRAVEKVIDYIKAGDIYQVNISQKFSAGFKGNPFSLFTALFNKNPASFFAFINAGTHQIISTSPERFIKQEKTRLETRPIKGTLPRDSEPEQDRINAECLVCSRKDDAELSMIVDLMRNDLGRIARGGSVRVKEHKRLEKYDNVFHLVSIVEAELAEDSTSVDVLRASFPGGSITGCPKIRAMEIIDEMESDKRHVYTGSIGYISFHDTMDFSIAIRTATVAGDSICYSVGGGIVFDSIPEKEYEETLHKGQTLMDTLASSGKQTSNSREQVWINGRFMDKNRAFVRADMPAFQYGAGIFETIRVEKGRPLHLSKHLDRFNASWKFLFDRIPPDVTWEEIIKVLIEQNGLGKSTAAVKILAAPGTPSLQCAGNQPNSDLFAVYAKKYVHRLELVQKNGLDIVTFPHGRDTFLADHKTLNYLYYHLAAGFAAKNLADEALILNHDGTVSETNTCNIMSVTEKELIVPDSNHALPGVMLNSVMALLSRSGYDIRFEKIFPDDFCRLRNIVLTNSLMGVVPVLSIDRHPVVHTEDIAFKLNQQLSGYGVKLKKTTPQNCDGK